MFMLSSHFILDLEVFPVTTVHKLNFFVSAVLAMCPIRHNLHSNLCFKESNCLYQSCCFDYDKRVSTITFASFSLSPAKFMIVIDSYYCVVSLHCITHRIILKGFHYDHVYMCIFTLYLHLSVLTNVNAE
jgi:hypothetical protein